MGLRDLRSLDGVFAEGITDLDGLDFLGEFSKELIIDSSLNEDTGTSAAGLAVVPADQRHG